MQPEMRKEKILFGPMKNMRSILFFILTTLCIFTADAAERRIVSLSPALTELVFLLGHGKELVGRSSACDFPEEVKRLPIAGDFADPNVERVLELSPTLVVSNDFINPGVAVNFERRGIQVMMVQCRTVAEYRNCVEQLGKLLDAETPAQNEISRIDRELKRIPEKQPIRLLWVIWDSPLMVAGQGSLPDDVIRLAGAENVAGKVPQAYFKCSFDWLLENPPDAIVWTASPQGWNKHRFWKKLAAVRDGKIISELDPDLLQRPGPRIFDGISELRKALEKLP